MRRFRLAWQMSIPPKSYESKFWSARAMASKSCWIALLVRTISIFMLSCALIHGTGSPLRWISLKGWCDDERSWMMVYFRSRHSPPFRSVVITGQWEPGLKIKPLKDWVSECQSVISSPNSEKWSACPRIAKVHSPKPPKNGIYLETWRPMS